MKNNVSKYKKIINAAQKIAPIGIGFVSNRQFIMVNEQFCKMVQYSEEELLGNDIRIVYTSDEEYLRVGREKVKQIQKYGASSVETKLRKKNAEEIDVILSSAAIDPDNPDFEVTFTVLDITKRKQAEEALAESEELLRQALKLESVGRLAGGIAHDFNNILAAILGYADLIIQQDKSLTPNTKKRIGGIKDAGIRGRDLIKQILAFSRRQELQMLKLDINKVIQDFEGLLKQTIRENIKISLILDSQPLYIKADFSQLEQIILNLAVNAQDAMPDGGSLEIKTEKAKLDSTVAHEYVKDTEYALITISDDGEGMDIDVQPNIFEPFFTTKEQGEGTGLGLSTVYGVVKQHAGHIFVYSEPNVGSTFKIYLPIYEKERSFEGCDVSVFTNISEGETILIAEDDEIVRGLIEDNLKDIVGYNVISASCGAEALKIVKELDKCVDLLLTDVVMPDMNGKILCEHMKLICPNLKVLFMSGYADNIISTHGVRDQSINFLQKPFTLRELNRKIRETLNSKEN